MISVGWIKCGSDGHCCDLAAGGRKATKDPGRDMTSISAGAAGE